MTAGLSGQLGQTMANSWPPSQTNIGITQPIRLVQLTKVAQPIGLAQPIIVAQPTGLAQPIRVAQTMGLAEPIGQAIGLLNLYDYINTYSLAHPLRLLKPIA